MSLTAKAVFLNETGMRREPIVQGGMEFKHEIGRAVRLMRWHAFGQWNNVDVGSILRHLIKTQRTPIHGFVRAMNVHLPCNPSRDWLISNLGVQRPL